MPVTIRDNSYEIANCSDELVLRLGEALQGSLPFAIADAQICYCLKTAIPSLPPSLVNYRLLMHPNNTQEQVFGRNLDSDELAEIVGGITVGMLQHRIERLSKLDDPKAKAKVAELRNAIVAAEKELKNLKLNILLGDSIEVKTSENSAQPTIKPQSPATLVNNARLSAIEADVVSSEIETASNLEAEVTKLRAELAQAKGNK